MAEKLNVQSRDELGKKNVRRLRSAGMVPAILYGHGEKNLPLAVGHDDMHSVLRHHSRVVELHGAVSEKALIRDLQWDVYGIEVLHVDFSRVSEHEQVTIRVSLDVRGDAAGVKEGGVLEVVVHEVEIECEAEAIPDKIGVVVKDLHLGDEIKAGDVPLPAGIRMITPAETLLIHCVKPKMMAEVVPTEASVMEPEVIGRKPGEEAEEEKET